MKSKLKKGGLASILKLAKKDHILPFTERPSEDGILKNKEKSSLDAFGLFSLFTADIIKEDVIFTR
jgi:hypothetical protein